MSTSLTRSEVLDPEPGANRSRPGRSAADRMSGAAIGLAASAALLAALAIVAAGADNESLRRLHPHSSLMSVASAIGVLLIALGVVLLRRPRSFARRAAGRATGVLVILVAGVVALRDLVTAWVMDRPGASPPAIGWVAPNTALALILLALALLAMDVRWPRRWPAREPLALAAAAIGFLAVLGYLYEVTELYWLERSTAMSLPASITVLLLSAALVLARPDRGLGGLLASRGIGGKVARWLLPVAVLIPTWFGYLRLAGERLDLFGAEVGTALLVSAIVLVFGGAIGWSATALARIDSARIRTLRELRDESVARELDQSRLRAMLDVLPVGAVLTDATGEVLETSRAARAIWGNGPPISYGAEDLRIEARDTRTGEPLDREEWGIRRALGQGEVSLGREIDVSTTGGEKTVLDYASPIRDERGRILGAVAVTVDITERKQSERELAALRIELEERVRQRTAELEAANQELQAFSYSVSHDLRAPLRWIDGFARALEEDHARELSPSARTYLGQLHDSVRRMSELIDGLLALSRVTARPMERERVDVSAMAREIAEELEGELPARRIEWTIADDLVVDGDRSLLRAVFDNLLRNAVKFTRDRDPARIEVGAREVRGETRWFVRDNGVGFDSAYSERLFRPFERLHSAREFEGTGVGLALVRRIVQRHGGRVYAESARGAGATIWLTFTAPGNGAE